VSIYKRPFSKPRVRNVKLEQKCSINLKNSILIFIRNRNWRTIRKGYECMGDINIELSEYGFLSAFEELVKYEIRLSESDSLDDYNGSKKRRHILC